MSTCTLPTAPYTMLILYLKDYPERIGEIIQRELHSEYTLTGSYSAGELVWELRYMGSRDTRILELAVSEYIVERVQAW